MKFVTIMLVLVQSAKPTSTVPQGYHLLDPGKTIQIWFHYFINLFSLFSWGKYIGSCFFLKNGNCILIQLLKEEMFSDPNEIILIRV